MREEPGTQDASQPLPRTHLAVLLLYSVVVMVFCWAALVRRFELSPERPSPWHDMMSMTALVGALAGTIHGLSSLVWHAGKSDLHLSWTAFYVARPFVGGAMAVVTYLVLTSGIGGFDVRSDVTLLAWAALAGLYSQPSLDKLKELFNTLFRTGSQPSPAQTNERERDVKAS
jgi:hypothetical protein